MNSIEKYNELIKANNDDNELFESFEELENQNDFEDFEDFEDLENYRMKKRMFLKQQRAQMPYLNKNKNNFGLPEIKKSTPQLQQTGLTPNPNSVVTQFDLKITRIDANSEQKITDPLPIIAFLPIAKESGYKGLLNLPLGVILSDIDVLNGNVEFEFVQVGKDETRIRIECLQVPYTDLLSGLQGAEFNIFKMRFLTPKTNYEAYLSQPLGTIARTMFGKISNIDTIPFTSQKSPSDYAPNNIDVDLNLHIQNDKGLTYVMPSVAAPDNSITISFFVNNLNKK